MARQLFSPTAVAHPLFSLCFSLVAVGPSAFQPDSLWPTSLFFQLFSLAVVGPSAFQPDSRDPPAVKPCLSQAELTEVTRTKEVQQLYCFLYLSSRGLAEEALTP